MAKKNGFGDDHTKSVSTSIGMAIASACDLACDIKGEGAIYRGCSPGPIFDSDQLLGSGLFEEDEESGMLISKSKPGDFEDFEAMRRFKHLRGMDLISVRNLYRSITVKFRGLSIFVKMRGTRRENSVIVDWWVCGLCFDNYGPLVKALSLDPEAISSN